MAFRHRATARLLTLGFKPKIDARISCRNHTEQTIAIAAKNASVRKKNEVLTPLMQRSSLISNLLIYQFRIPAGGRAKGWQDKA